jgi:hypothetical protein
LGIAYDIQQSSMFLRFSEATTAETSEFAVQIDAAKAVAKEATAKVDSKVDALAQQTQIVGKAALGHQISVSWMSY